MLMQQASASFESHKALLKLDAALAARMLSESLCAVELLHLMRDAVDAASARHVDGVLRSTAPEVFMQFEEEYRSVEVASMGGVFRTYFRLDPMCLSVEKSAERSTEITESLNSIPRADPHLKARAFTIRLLVARQQFRLLDRLTNRSGAVVRWATKRQQMIVRAPYQHATVVGLILILLWRGNPANPWSSAPTSRWHVGDHEIWARALDVMISLTSLVQAFLLGVSLWVCVMIEVPLVRAEIQAERKIVKSMKFDTFSSRSVSLIEGGGSGVTPATFRPPPPDDGKSGRYNILMSALLKMRMLIEERNSHLVGWCMLKPVDRAWFQCLKPS